MSARDTDEELKTHCVKEQNPNRVIGTYDNLSFHDVKRALQSLVKVTLSALFARDLVHRR